jgi:hypothetical protein
VVGNEREVGKERNLEVKKEINVKIKIFSINEKRKYVRYEG